MICLDTNAVIRLLSARDPGMRGRLQEALVNREIVGLPSVVTYELWYGVWKSRRREANAAALKTFLALDLVLWSFDAEDAEEAGAIRAELERMGTPIGPYDLLIAAQARRRAATLITANLGEFRRVPGLQTDDWSTV